jgi:hypothetical protein
MASLEYDLGYLQSALSTLEDYLLSADLYWSIGDNPPKGEPPYPSLTLGNVLLAQAMPLIPIRRFKGRLHR